MDQLPNPPSKDETRESASFFEANDALTTAAASLAKNPAPQTPVQAEARGGGAMSLDIPVAELRLLAKAHGATEDAQIGMHKRATQFRFFIAGVIIIGALAGWLHYGDAATAIANATIFNSALLSTPSDTTQVALERSNTPTDVPSAPAISPTEKPFVPPPAETSELLLQQLDTIARDLASVQQALQQLVFKQADMARNIATIQTSIENSQKAAAAPRLPSAKPIQSEKPSLQRSAVPSAPQRIVGAPKPPVQTMAPPAPAETSSGDHRTSIPRPPSSLRDY